MQTTMFRDTRKHVENGEIYLVSLNRFQKPKKANRQCKEGRLLYSRRDRSPTKRISSAKKDCCCIPEGTEAQQSK
jgi:hypothetical protein